MNSKPIDANSQNDDEYWMAKALQLAKAAALRDEVPVGAILVRNGKLLAKAGNGREAWATALGHAELVAIHRACLKEKSWRLLNCTLYVTLEPCLMCAGGIQQARLSRVVFGAFDKKAGALHSLYQVGADQRLNHRFEVTGGVLQEECAKVLSDFFKAKRQK